MLEPIREILSNDPRGTRTDLTQDSRRRGGRRKSNERPSDKYETMYVGECSEQDGDIHEGKKITKRKRGV
jgi:hypothetical protein